MCSPASDSTRGQERASSNEEESEIIGRKIQSDTEITVGRDSMPCVWNGRSAGFVQGSDGEIWDEDLADEGGVGQARWVGKGKRGGGRFDEIWVDVFGFVTFSDNKVLEKRVGRKRSREQTG